MPGPKAPVGTEVSSLLRLAQDHVKNRRLLEAGRCYLEATRQQPDCFEAFWRLGQLLIQFNQWPEALPCLQTAARLQPQTPQIHLLLGAVYKRLGRLEEAALCCQHELQLSPSNPDVHYNLGLVLQNLGRLSQAAAAYEEALRLRPDYLDALLNLSLVLRQLSRWDDALHCLETALRCHPQSAPAHWERCITLLSRGDFQAGWKEYEWRWKLKDFTTPPAQYPPPLWDGSDLQGKRILLHCEQGYGDILQFARYASLVAQRHGQVILACPPALRSLMESVPGVREVATHPAHLPPFDVHSPLMSLPALFATTLQTLPANTPYVSAPKNGFHLQPSSPHSFKVGLVWAGDPKHRNDRNRSLRLEYFLPLMGLPGIEWFSLQAGEHAADVVQAGLTGRLVDLGSRFKDFGETAAAIEQLDLVISVDTAVAHLTGALAKPIWTLLPFEAEWRWMLNRQDSPWYPGMRLFRQNTAGDWKGLLQQVGQELKALQTSTISG